jgi:hypothetical protein
VPGLVCPSCAAELQGAARRNQFTLVWYDPSADPYGTGSRYGRHTLRTEDWRRVAAGGVPAEEERQLREEALREFWAAMLAGQVSTSTATDSYPATTVAGEKVVITFAALQIRSRFVFLYEHDTGQIWLTTRQLFYEGGRGDVSLPLRDTSGCDLADTGGGGNLMVEVKGKDRRDRFRFIMGSGPIDYTVDGLALQLPWDERAFIELFESLRRKA